MSRLINKAKKHDGISRITHVTPEGKSITMHIVTDSGINGTIQILSPYIQKCIYSDATKAIILHHVYLKIFIISKGIMREEKVYFEEEK